MKILAAIVTSAISANHGKWSQSCKAIKLDCENFTTDEVATELFMSAKDANIDRWAREWIGKLGSAHRAIRFAECLTSDNLKAFICLRVY